ncbi:MAG TPA: DsbA family oxidoreductase [Novosphingobium sp.]|nr:DsbA family oxidoreductase [Novosphingobium sp.]
MNEPHKVTVDIVSDVMCPWCIVGLLRLEKALEALEGEIAAAVTWRPFELNPDLGPEGRDWGQAILEKYGKLPPPGPTQTELAASELGYDMSYQGNGEEPTRWSWNSHGAHMLLRWMLDEHGAQAQNRLSRALFDAHFQYRRNVSDKDTLVAIVREAGLPTDGAAQALDDAELSRLVHAEERWAREAGINSVPTFVINGSFALPGAQDPETLAQYLRKAVELSAEASAG